MNIQEKLELTLNNIGDTPDEIAAFLEGQGVKGYRGAAYVCVLANYLRSVFDLSTSVGREEVVLREQLEGRSASGHPNFRIVARLRLPNHVKKFTTGFDSGNFPTLVNS